MGKKVFDVAKDLGLDHRVVLKRCDELSIKVKNYMSELSEPDVLKVRDAFEADRLPKTVDEKSGAPGVMRRRPREPVPVAKPAPSPLKAPTPMRPIAPLAAPIAPIAQRVSAPEPVVVAAPVEHVAGTPSVAVTPSPVVAASPSPVVAAPPSAVIGGSVASHEAVQTPSSSEAPVAPAAVAASNYEGEPVSEARPPVEGVAELDDGRRPAPPPASAIIGRPSPLPTGAAAGSTPSPGGAKILGTVPLDLLRSRTARPPMRRPGGLPGGPPGAPGAFQGDRRPLGPGGPGPRRPLGARPMPVDVNAAVPLVPVDRGDGTRRRARPGGPLLLPGAPPPTSDEAAREAERARLAKAPGKKRQVVSREDLYSSNARLGRGRKRKLPSKKGSKTQVTKPAAHKRVVRVDGTISVGELGKALGVKSSELLVKLMQMGTMVTVNHQLDIETATLLAADFEYGVTDIAFDEDEFIAEEVEGAPVDPDAILRAPVVTVMGHVDHGKTSLLDRIRKSKVASGEAGGITQHIGAYRVKTAHGDVVFLDTPGHAAFTAMRARGASVTDLVVLVVAADDGVMPQTIEAINHARLAEVPVIVAINKVDKAGVDVERIKQELTKYNLVSEEWGGDTMMIPVSALKGTGMTELLEGLALQAEVLELRANPKKPGQGHVIEARVDKGRGPVATVLVQDGTLKTGDFVVCGAQMGRIRAMLDENGQRVKEAGPSTPVEILGLDGIPPAGEAFNVIANEKDAKRIAESRTEKLREKELVASGPGATPAELLARIGGPAAKVLRLVVKTDVVGTLEALRFTLEQQNAKEVQLKIVHSGVGIITESDIMLASAAEAVCIGFNVGPDTNAKRAADQSNVTIRRFSVIYEVADEVRAMMSGMLTPEIVETPLGRAECKTVFQIARFGAVAGCMVQDGKVVRGARARVMRAGVKVHEGKISGLKRFKEDVREVTHGYECGISVDGYAEIQAGDIIDVVEVKEVARQLT